MGRQAVVDMVGVGLGGRVLWETSMSVEQFTKKVSGEA